MLDNPNLSLLDCIESAILEFHNRRRYLVDCLRYLFEATTFAQSPEALPIHIQLESYARQKLIPPPAAGEAHLSHKLLLQIQALSQPMARLHTAVQNAASDTQVIGGMLTQYIFSSFKFIAM
jgi:nuclear pore complex protein Nup205